ncbi:hypothetical protein NKH18_13780 [Streptomyces sp. M10(2022)]
MEQPRATGSSTSATATACTTTGTPRTNSRTTPASTGEGAARQQAHEGPGRVTSPTARGPSSPGSSTSGAAGHEPHRHPQPAARSPQPATRNPQPCENGTERGSDRKQYPNTPGPARQPLPTARHTLCSNTLRTGRQTDRRNP